MATEKGYGLWFSKEEIPIVGLRTGGVKGINLKDDKLVSISNFDSKVDNYILFGGHSESFNPGRQPLRGP